MTETSTKIKKLLLECQETAGKAQDHVKRLRQISMELAVLVCELEQMPRPKRPTAKLYDIKAAREAKNDPPCEGR